MGASSRDTVMVSVRSFIRIAALAFAAITPALDATSNPAWAEGGSASDKPSVIIDDMRRDMGRRPTPPSSTVAPGYERSNPVPNPRGPRLLPGPSFQPVSNVQQGDGSVVRWFHDPKTGEVRSVRFVDGKPRSATRLRGNDAKRALEDLKREQRRQGAPTTVIR